MKKIITLSLIVALSTVASVFIFKSYASSQKLSQNKSEGSPVVTVNYEFGTDLSPTGYTNIYAIWIENAESNFIQNISICKRVLTGDLTGTALPYWKINKYPVSSSADIDAVTSATQKNCNFSVSATLKDTTIRKFTVYCEIDRSYEPNDWFTDQPAVLYAATVNLDSATTSTCELKPVGWTPNEKTVNVIPNTPAGVLQSEMKYITNLKNDTAFGDTDPRSLTSIVKSITATVQQTSGARGNTISEDDAGISLQLNQTAKQISVVSKEIIDAVVVTDLQGKIIFQSRPGSKNESIALNSTTTSKGLYFVKITTRKGCSVHTISIKN